MCGIAGIIYKDKSYNVDKNIIKKMTDSIAHRGPNAEGSFVENNLGLGHRRLSIIDLSYEGNQPMISKDSKYVLVFNGEIYNYIEIRRKLEKLGSTFSTKTDTEVIIECYRRFGTDCVKKFNGMWSFALYDREKNIVFFSRDRFGVKPFYYVDRDDIFAFASEPKAILAAFPEEKLVNESQIWRFIKGYPDSIDTNTFYKNIVSLESSHNIIYDLKTNKIVKNQYWKIDNKRNYEKWIKGKDPLKTFRKLLEDSVKLRLRSDVPIGTSLSGGLDSSLLVGIMTKKFGMKVKTFSSIYKDKDCNEKEYIDSVNRYNNTKAVHVYPKGDQDFIERFKKIVYHHDCPLLSGSCYSQYSVDEKASEYVKVLIDGQGADELFGGYLPSFDYRVEDILEKHTFLNKIRATKLITIFGIEFKDNRELISSNNIRKAFGKKNLDLWKKKDTTKYSHFRELFNEDFLQKVAKESIPTIKGDVKGKLNQMLYKQFFQTSLPNILMHADAASMMFSVEVRNPFLDYRLVEFAMALDGKYKVKNQWTKWIMRKTCQEYLPKKVVRRTNKMGYPAPFSRWAKQSKVKDEIYDIIMSLEKRNIFNMDTVKEYYQQHMQGECDRGFELCRLMTLELWWRECID